MDFYFQQRICQECGTPLKGRRDQKFCADYCRNQFNNRIYAQKWAIQRQINRILLNNQRILAQLLFNEKKRNVLERELYNRGFNFEFHTHRKMTKKGQVYIFCYDYGYLRLNEQQLYIVHQNNSTIQ
jgi:predicted nucleic acid-binding Zn ribbon protein